MNNINDIWNEAMPSRFATELVQIRDVELMRAFLRDVMTESELRDVSARLRAAEMLRAGSTYVDIIKETKLSSRTIARISDWMQNGAGGYAAVLEGAHVWPVDVG
jgi:TrpR-related protein YerC/YecD